MNECENNAPLATTREIACTAGKQINELLNQSLNPITEVPGRNDGQ